MIIKYFIYFLIYSFFGWLLEIFYTYKKSGKLVNRGFLIGPICTIYGFGVLLIIIIGNSNNLLLVFFKSVIISFILEYFTSYIMEKLFHAKWWDYSKCKYNINGRICLQLLIVFGVLGSFINIVFHPLIIKFVNLFSDKFCNLAVLVLLIIIILDYIISFVSIIKIKNNIKLESKDQTEYIKKETFKLLKSFRKIFLKGNYGRNY